jgi:hypothetical protein
MHFIARKLFAIACLSLLVIAAQAQSGDQPASDQKPYKLLTSGKQITIKSSKGIRQVMLWTTGGNRVVEQKEINNNSYVLNIPVDQKTFFLMIGLGDGKIYTEKIGLP